MAVWAALSGRPNGRLVALRGGRVLFDKPATAVTDNDLDRTFG